MKMKILGLLLAASISVINAADSLNYTYKGQEITPDNLFELANLPEFKLGEAIDELVRAWVDINPQLFDRLLNNPALWSQAYFLTNANIKFLNYVLQGNNFGDSNYIFSPGSDVFGYDLSNVIVRIACHGHRLVNLLRQHGERDWFYGSYVRGIQLPDELDAEINTQEATYQTASIMARYILAKTFLQDTGIQDIAVPLTFLLTRDGSSDVSDENSIIVTEKISGLVRLEKFVQENDLTEAQIVHLLEFILGASIWDICSNTYVKDGVVYVIDLEQPNNCSPDMAFFKVNQDGLQDSNEWNAMSGITKFYNVLVKYGKSGQEQIIRNWVLNNDLIKNFKRFDSLKVNLAL